MFILVAIGLSGLSLMAVLTDRNKHLNLSELQQLLRQDNFWSDALPVKPSGGDVFCYKALDESKKGTQLQNYTYFL